MASRLSVFEVARLRRIALLGLYYRTVLPVARVRGAGRGVAEEYAARMSREQLTAAILGAQDSGHGLRVYRHPPLVQGGP